MPETDDECVSIHPFEKRPLNLDLSIDEQQFSHSLVQRLVEQLEDEPLPHLTPNEQQSLIVLMQATLEVGKYFHYVFCKLTALLRLSNSVERWTRMVFGT